MVVTCERSRNVTHFICAAVKSPAVWGAIDLTSYYRGAEAGGGRQEHDTDNSWVSLSLSVSLVSHRIHISLHIILPSPNSVSQLSLFFSPPLSFFSLSTPFSRPLSPKADARLALFLCLALGRSLNLSSSPFTSLTLPSSLPSTSSALFIITLVNFHCIFLTVSVSTSQTTSLSVSSYTVHNFSPIAFKFYILDWHPLTHSECHSVPFK